MTRFKYHAVHSPKNRLSYMCIVSLLMFGALEMGCSHRDDSSGQPPSLKILPGEGVGEVKLGMSVEDMSRLLGSSGKREGRFLNYPDFGLDVILQDDHVHALICYYDSREYGSFTGSTNSGIGAKSTIADVLAKYGAPSYESDHILSKEHEYPGGKEHELIYSSNGVRFNFVDGKLYFIQVFPVGEMSELGE